VAGVIDAPGLPLYRRIQSDLRDRIAGGELAPGTQLATEQELMTRYDVSRATVRQALAGLIADGYLEIRRGLGTYVRQATMEHRLGGFYSFSREIERHGLRPGTRVRSVRILPADDQVAAALDVAEGTPVVALARIRLADDQPLVTETSYLPSSRFPGLKDVDFTRRRLYDVLTDDYGTRPVRARETFEAVLMDGEEAGLLGGSGGDAALRVERVTFDSDGRIIEFCRSTLRADRYRYSVELGDT
jgi:GntR family transcriptional regulator